jgi:predicted DNA-binding transcriptional regulator AlpA
MMKSPLESLKPEPQSRSNMKLDPHAIDLSKPGRLLTRDVLALSRWSHSTLYTRMDSGKFPKPEKDGGLNYWLTQVVRDALKL